MRRRRRALLLALPLPWGAWAAPLEGVPSSLDLAADFFRKGGLDIAREEFDALLFDSRDDLRHIVSKGVGQEMSVWRFLAPGHGVKELELMWMEWTTPAVVNSQEAMNPELKAELGRAHRLSCMDYCAGGATGESEGRGEGCCAPERFCPRLQHLLLRTLTKAADRLQELSTRYSALTNQIMDVEWPFAQPWIVTATFDATELIDKVGWLFAFLWSRLAANPTLASCLLADWGLQLQRHLLIMLQLWREARRGQEAIAWELVATARICDFRWSQIGRHIEVLNDVWKRLSDVLGVPLTALKNLQHQAADRGWSALAKQPSKTDRLAAGDSGEYPGVLLARSQFMNAWFLDKPVLRYLVRHVFTPGQSVGEFGAFGGEYSAWLNDTGLVRAFAFDGTEDAYQITGGQVSGGVDLSQPIKLFRRFDWVLCLEVGEHLPKGSEDILLDNIVRHARVGAVISWATHDYPSPYHPNTMTLEESTQLIERHGFRQDVRLTKGLRRIAELSWLKQSTGVGS